jgi:hypothetical protein
MRIFFRCLLLAVAGFLAPVAGAQEEITPYSVVPKVDWYYAASFGTGRYRAGERVVSVLRIPVAWNLGEWNETGAAIRLLTPVTLGAVDFNLDDVLDDPLDSVSMMTFTPGLEVRIPWRDTWLLKPFAFAGGGVELDGDDRAWIYSLGISARRDLPCERVRCTLGLAATWAGFNSSERGRDDMSNVSAGLDFIFAGGLAAFERTLHPGVFVLYRNYLSDFGFIFDPLGIEPLSQEWEAGFSFTADRPFSIFGYRFGRLGLSYRRGGELEGIHFTGSFPF